MVSVWVRRTIPIASIVALLSVGPPSAAGQPITSWTLDDIISAPIVTDLRLARDGQSALYVVRSADPERNLTTACLRLADFARHQQQCLMSASVIEQLRPIPGTDSWSVIADLGQGMQLYRIDADYKVSPIVIHQPTVGIGSADQSIRSALSDEPRHVGVLSYSWSPDGNWLWYAVLQNSSAQPKVLFDEQIIGQIGVRRPSVEAHVEYHLRSRQGQDRVVASRPASDRIAFYFGGNATWDAGRLRYNMEDVDPAGAPRFTTSAVDLESLRVEQQMQPPANPFGIPAAGPLGGALATGGFGSTRLLTETIGDGTTRTYGRVPYIIGDPRSAGAWRSPDGSMAVVGVRMIDHPRYALVLVDRHGTRLVNDEASLTKCDFLPNSSWGVCIREGLALAPTLVKVDLRIRSTRPLFPVSERHSAITPLRVTPKIWTNKLGYSASGFIMWPRQYAPGHRYPAIVITHGSDADDRFARPELQWNYPAQLFAERGYIVLLINDPSLGQSARLSAAYDQWTSGKGTTTPEEMQQLIWLNGVYSFESAVAEMVDAGIIDPGRVGIAGYSRGSQMANVTMTHSSAFRAASSGDGSYLEPYAYSTMFRSYDAIFGGSPYGPAIAQYRRITPSLRASTVRGAILQQLASPLGGAMDFYRALRDAGAPAQVTFYPGRDASSDETHIFHVPANRKLAMRENIAWFDFWLRNEQSGMMPFPERYPVWAALASAERSHAIGQ